MAEEPTTPTTMDVLAWWRARYAKLEAAYQEERERFEGVIPEDREPAFVLKRRELYMMEDVLEYLQREVDAERKAR